MTENKIDTTKQIAESLERTKDSPWVVLSIQQESQADDFLKELNSKGQDLIELNLNCAASVFKRVKKWDDASLEIKWDSNKKEFAVTFRGVGPVNLPIETLLSKAVPLHIAESSNCECGKTLQLGDYRILSSNDDFTFEGAFFCPQCKAKTLKERSGLRHFISTWFRGLKKLQINATGVGIERE